MPAMEVVARIACNHARHVRSDCTLGTEHPGEASDILSIGSGAEYDPVHYSDGKYFWIGYYPGAVLYLDGSESEGDLPSSSEVAGLGP